MNNTKIWAYTGFVFIGISGLLNWIMKGMKVNSAQINNALIESVFPSFSRVIPIWVQFVRLIGYGLLAFFSARAVKVTDGDLVFSFEYYWIIAIGGLLFFCLPFLFPKKDAHDA